MALILIIEDENHVLENICELLWREGYDVLKAQNGEIGIHKARRYKPDLILCDINMPGISGFEVLEEIRNDHATLNIPFIFLSIRDKDIDIKRAFEMGAQDYITKPYDNNELIARIKKQLKLKTETDIQKENMDKNSQELIECEQEIARLKLYISELESDKKEES